MHNIDDNENGWDDLASEFGLEPDTSKSKPQPAKPERELTAVEDETIPTPPPPRNLSNPLPEPDVALEEDEPQLHAGALFDPGPEQVLEDTGVSSTAATGEQEEFDETDSEELFDTEAGPEQEQEEGGKRKRKRRRRKKKKGPGEPAVGEADDSEAVEGEESDVGEVTEATVPDDAEVEEGEAPEVLAEEDHVPTSAVDEELEAVANQPKQEWNVMTWADLIGKLYRPN